MSTVQFVVAAVGAIAALIVVAWFLITRQGSERADSHVNGSAESADDTSGDATGRGTLPGDVVERPAGPGAEAQGVPERGRTEPGPAGPPG